MDGERRLGKVAFALHSLPTHAFPPSPASAMTEAAKRIVSDLGRASGSNATGSRQFALGNNLVHTQYIYSTATYKLRRQSIPSPINNPFPERLTSVPIDVCNDPPSSTGARSTCPPFLMFGSNASC